MALTLADEHAIRAVMYRYCRGIDRVDLELVRQCYHPDATDDHGAFRGSVDDFLVWIGRLLPRYGMTMHFLANMLLEGHPQRDDIARVETYGIAEHQTPDGPPELNLTIGFRYLDRFERREAGEWRIASRFCTTEWVRANAPATMYPIGDRFARGRRDGTDWVFEPWDDAPPSR